MTTSGGAGTTLPSANSSTFPDVLGAPASLIGSELSVYLAPAFLMPLAALCGPLPVAAFTFPDCALRGTSGGATMSTPVGRAHPMSRADKRPRARRTGFSIIGSESPVQLGSGPSLCPAPMPQGVSYVHHWADVYIREVGPGLFVLLILPLGLLVLEPVPVLLAVGHGGTFEVRFAQLPIGPILGIEQISIAQIGLAHFGAAKVGSA
jgi:hypothetical protein